MTRLLPGGTAILILLGVGSVVWMIARGDPTRPDPESPSLVARGKTVYAQHCAACHGASLEGQPNWRARLPNGRLPAPPHDAAGHTWHHSDGQLFAMVRNGTAGMMPGYQTDMPAYKDILSDGDIRAVLSFIKSTWPPGIRQRQEKSAAGSNDVSGRLIGRFAASCSDRPRLGANFRELASVNPRSFQQYSGQDRHMLSRDCSHIPHLVPRVRAGHGFRA